VCSSDLVDWSEPEDADCAVIGAALDRLYADADRRYLLIRDLTSAESLSDHGTTTSFLRDSLGVDLTTIDNFTVENSSPSPVCTTLPTRVPAWILHRSAGAHAAIHVRRPVNRPSPEFEYPGVITVSRAGLSADGRQALLTVTNSCGGLCGTGWVVVLQREAEGRWRVRRAEMLWIS